MRIGIFSELYPPHIGGQEVRYKELAASLIQLGHSVDVYCIRHAADIPSEEVCDGVSVHRYPLAQNYQKPLFRPLKRTMLPLFRYSFWVRKHARSDQFDLMLFNQWPLAHIALARRQNRSRFVLDWCEVRSGRFYRFLMGWLPKIAARNIAVSHAVAETVSRVSGRNVLYIPSGIWPALYHGKPHEQRSGILYLGRVTEHKNIELLLEAFMKLKQTGYAGDLFIAGSGPSLQKLKEQSQSGRLAGHVHFLGFIDEAMKIELLADSEILVIPSRREGFPRVVAEAMASGLPVATVDYPDNGTKNIVREYQIGQVSQPTADALAEVIRDTLRDWTAYSNTGIQRSTELDWSTLTTQLLG
jgi:glycosyltransferase involved in cell wall biosynthesis